MSAQADATFRQWLSLMASDLAGERRRRRVLAARLQGPAAVSPLFALAACGGGGGGVAPLPAPQVSASADMTAVAAGATAVTGNVLANDVATGGTASVVAVAAPGGAAGIVGQPVAGALGTLTVNVDGSYSYAVANNAAVRALGAGVTATESFTYTPSVAGNAGTPQTLTVTVTGVNDAPTAVDDTGFSVGEDAAAVSSGNLLSNDADPDSGQTLTVTAVTGGTVGTPIVGTYGSLVLNANGSFTYTLNNADPDTQALTAGAVGVDLFTYSVSDGTATSSATLRMSVFGANDAPVAGTDFGFSVAEDGVATSSANVLTNDSDPDAGAVLRVSGVTGGTLGTPLVGTYGRLVLNADGSFTYTLDNADPDTQALAAGQTGTDSFTYSVSDGTATSTGILRMSVFGANDGPTAVNDSGFSVTEDSVAVSSANVLTNDVDPDAGTVLRVTGLTGGTLGTPLVGTYGSLVLNADGSFTYTLNNSDPDTQALTFNQPGTELFTYTASDGVVSSGATLTITVNGTGEATTPTGLDLLREDDTGQLATDNITRQTSGLTIEGVAQAGVRVDLLSGATVLATTTANASGLFRADIALAGGTYSITARSVDPAGNTSALSTPLVLTVDTTVATSLPDLVAASDSGRSNTDNITRGPTLDFVGTADPGSIVELFVRATGAGSVVLQSDPLVSGITGSTPGVATADANGNYAIRVSAGGGAFTGYSSNPFTGSETTHQVLMRVTDVAGNVTLSSELTLQLDTQRTAISNLQLLPADDTGTPGDRITTKNMVTITGTTEALAEVSFGGNTVLADASGNFALPVMIQDGANTITPVSVDRAGNTTGTLAVQSSIVVTRDAILGAVVEQIPIFDDDFSQIALDPLVGDFDFASRNGLHQEILPIA